MPLIVPPPGHAPDRLPAHLMRWLTIHRAQGTVDPSDGSVTVAYVPEPARARIGRGRSSEATGDGRQAAVWESRLFTEVPLDTGDRVGDPADPEGLWEAAGPSVPVWEAGRLHHYETPLRRVDG